MFDIFKRKLQGKDEKRKSLLATAKRILEKDKRMLEEHSRESPCQGTFQDHAVWQ